MSEPPVVSDLELSPNDPAAGRQLGRYTIQSEIGHGASATIYRAIDTKHNNPVALKVLDPQRGLDETQIKRFLEEAKVARRLRHPNLVKVKAAGTVGDELFMALELVEGDSLAHVLERSGRLHPRRAVEVCLSVAKGLAYLHQNNLVHRDVKPSNILLSAAGPIKLSDLGLVRNVGQVKNLTREGTFLGSIQYAAPEQIDKPSEVDHRADIYALGASLYHMLFGHPPYESLNAAEIIGAIVEGRLEFPADKVSAPIAKVVIPYLRILMARKPEDRPPHMAQVLHDMVRLRAVLAGYERSSETLLPVVRRKRGASDAGPDDGDWDEELLEIGMPTGVELAILIACLGLVLMLLIWLILNLL